MQTEFEAKYRDVDHIELRAKLRSRGAKLVEPARLMRRRNFDFPDKRLAEAKSAWVRVRDEGSHATARTPLGLHDASGKDHFFVGEIVGTIVAPRREGFGWDAIFVPGGYHETFGELPRTEKHKVSMRSIAAKKLANHLEAHSYPL